MEEIAEFSLENKSDTDSELQYKKLPCGLLIPGLLLEKQYQLSDQYYLLITSDDCPYEEGLHLILLDQQFNILEILDIGLPYTAAAFDNASITSSNDLEFDFLPETRYQVSIEPNGQRFRFAKDLTEVTHRNNVFEKRFIRIQRLSPKGS
ncbi:MAG: hypothetical protein OEZ43_17855 [Gammaproteobacteria bacterium]|nr:hypothetical protein [Gammaproteobacteria bacterium]